MRPPMQQSERNFHTLVRQSRSLLAYGEQTTETKLLGTPANILRTPHATNKKRRRRGKLPYRFVDRIKINFFPVLYACKLTCAVSCPIFRSYPNDFGSSFRILNCRYQRITKANRRTRACTKFNMFGIGVSVRSSFIPRRSRWSGSERS